MANGIYIEIKKRILDAEEGSIFVTSDFTDIATTTTVRKCLGRQVEEKNIRRIIDGVYEKPVYSNLLREYVPATPEKVAYAIARGIHRFRLFGPISVTVHIESFLGIISRCLLSIVQIVKFHICLRQPLWLLRH